MAKQLVNWTRNKEEDSQEQPIQDYLTDDMLQGRINEDERGRAIFRYGIENRILNQERHRKKRFSKSTFIEGHLQNTLTLTRKFSSHKTRNLKFLGPIVRNNKYKITTNNPGKINWRKKPAVQTQNSYTVLFLLLYEMEKMDTIQKPVERGYFNEPSKYLQSSKFVIDLGDA